MAKDVFSYIISTDTSEESFASILQGSYSQWACKRRQGMTAQVFLYYMCQTMVLEYSHKLVSLPFPSVPISSPLSLSPSLPFCIKI